MHCTEVCPNCYLWYVRSWIPLQEGISTAKLLCHLIMAGDFLNGFPRRARIPSGRSWIILAFAQSIPLLTWRARAPDSNNCCQVSLLSLREGATLRFDYIWFGVLRLKGLLHMRHWYLATCETGCFIQSLTSAVSMSLSHSLVRHEHLGFE